MDSTVDSLDQAYQAFIATTTAVLEAYNSSGGAKTPATEAAIENLMQQWELLRVACDRAEQLVEAVRRRIRTECLVDEATGGSSSSRAGHTALGIPPVSAVKLEQIWREVTKLVIDIKQRVRVDIQQRVRGRASNSRPATATTAPPGAKADSDANSNPATATTAPLSPLTSEGVQPGANADSDACSGTTQSSQRVRGASNSNPAKATTAPLSYLASAGAQPGANADFDAFSGTPQSSQDST